MSYSLEYLESLARSYALEAAKQEKLKNKALAAEYYRKAASIFEKILRIHPDHSLANVYRDLAKGYRRRAKQLEEQCKILATGPTSSESSDELEVEDLIMKERPSTKFEDIIGLDEAKQAIIEAIIYPAKRPDLFPLGWPRGILLFGPPGCGKTMLATAVAGELDAYFIHVDAATIMSKWLGDAEKNVAKIFKKARQLYIQNAKPVIIFIDEVDSLLGMYSNEVGGEARVRTQFLKEMDGIQDKLLKYQVYVIGATNKPWRLDAAFIRRFQKRIYIPPPNLKAREELFKHYCRSLKISNDVNFKELAKLTDGYSASDIRDIVAEAHLRTVRELFRSNNIYGDPRPISMNDFLEVLKYRKPSITKEMLKLYESWSEKFKAI